MSIGALHVITVSILALRCRTIYRSKSYINRKMYDGKTYIGGTPLAVEHPSLISLLSSTYTVGRRCNNCGNSGSTNPLVVAGMYAGILQDELSCKIPAYLFEIENDLNWPLSMVLVSLAYIGACKYFYRV